MNAGVSAMFCAPSAVDTPPGRGASKTIPGWASRTAPDDGRRAESEDVIYDLRRSSTSAFAINKADRIMMLWA
jgi:hypothetical protein